MMSHQYKISPLPQLGAEVIDFDLTAVASQDKKTIQRLRQDVAKHKLIVFRNQANMTPEKHLAIARWFGKIESTFYNHPKSPSHDIFRVSNSDTEGCRNVGRTGWHIDGSFMDKPFSHSLYHSVATPRRGATSFISLADVVAGLSEQRRAAWNRLWMVGSSSGCGRGAPVHPLIYTHPDTGLPTLCFHLGMTDRFIQDYGTHSERRLTRAESFVVLREIETEILRDPSRIYHHEYRPGDFIISDNLAVGHEASPETQLPVDEVGLRVMHRVTIAGKTRPGKAWSLVKDDTETERSLG